MQLLVSEIDRLKSEIDLRDKRIIDLENKAMDQQDQLEFIGSELYRLEEENRQLNEELSIIKAKYVDYNSLYKKYLDNMANQVIMGIEMQSMRGKL